MSAVVETGWGAGPWGLTPWGGSSSDITDDLAVISAVAIAENIVRVEFNKPPFYTGTLEPNEASNRQRYSVVAVAGTYGLDEKPVRKVSPVIAERAIVEQSVGRLIDVYVDRPFSPFPAQYRISANNLKSTDGFYLDPQFTSFVFYGLQRLHVPNQPMLAIPSRDIANPQNRDALEGLPEASNLILGAFVVDDTGDIATDEGIVNLKKRIFRRLVTRKGGFAHMPDYGVGVLQYSKKLNNARTRQRLAAEASRQIEQEPDVQKAVVVAEPRAPGLVVFKVLVRTIKGAGVKFEYPFSVN